MGMELAEDVRSRGLNDEGILHIPGLLSRKVRLADGALAHYVTAGETGPAVILLHGSIEGSSGTAGWRFMATMLGANGFRVYAPDRPGFGRSDVSRAQYLDAGPKAQIDFVIKFADALGIDKFHLAGNSGGCVLSQQVVVNHPTRVLSVAFIAGGLGDISSKPRVTPAEGRFTPNNAYALPKFDGTEDGMRDLMAGIIYKAEAIWPDLIKMRVQDATVQREAREKFGAAPYGLAPITDPNVLAIITSKGRLDKLTVPMIYLYGLQDVLSPVENGFNQEDAVSNIQFFYPDECGHQGQTDQPDMHNQVFLEFFRDGKVSWESAKWAGVSRRRPINPALVEEPAGGFPKSIPEAYTDTDTLRSALKA